jgi:hypothetical protein
MGGHSGREDHRLSTPVGPVRPPDGNDRGRQPWAMVVSRRDRPAARPGRPARTAADGLDGDGERCISRFPGNQRVGRERRDDVALAVRGIAGAVTPLDHHRYADGPGSVRAALSAASGWQHERDHRAVLGDRQPGRCHLQCPPGHRRVGRQHHGEDCTVPRRVSPLCPADGKHRSRQPRAMVVSVRAHGAGRGAASGAAADRLDRRRQFSVPRRRDSRRPVRSRASGRLSGVVGGCRRCRG